MSRCHKKQSSCYENVQAAGVLSLDVEPKSGPEIELIELAPGFNDKPQTCRYSVEIIVLAIAKMV